uniref:Uncharacterized protein n=1 Tax=viral metagenome TaxID=1070528 RepID=A0A6C0BU68_9ZZZZ
MSKFGLIHKTYAMAHQVKIVRGNIIITVSQPATIRYTKNDWLSYQDVKSDHFLTIRIILNESCTVKYAINYETHWDNNEYENYSIDIDKDVYQQLAMLPHFKKNSPSKKRVSFDLTKNEWFIVYKHHCL